MRYLILPLALAAGITVPAAAQWPAPVERALSSDYKDCMATGDAARGVTIGLMNCSGEEIGRQDARLNQAYRMTMQRLPKARQASLRTAQRTWIKRRDATCRHESDEGGGGSLSGVIYSQCILRETIGRRLWLERYRG